jgi:hypothetical protein
MCTSNEIVVTTMSIITTRPSVRVPDCELDPGVLPPRDAVHDRRDFDLATMAAALGAAEEPVPEAASPSA